MWTRALSRALMVVGGILAISFSIVKLDTIEGPDEFLYMGIIFMGVCCILLGFKGMGGCDD